MSGKDDSSQQPEGLISNEEFAASLKRIGDMLDEQIAECKKKTMRRPGKVDLAQKYIQAVNDAYSLQYLLRLSGAMGIELQKLRQLVVDLNGENADRHARVVALISAAPEEGERDPFVDAVDTVKKGKPN